MSVEITITAWYVSRQRLLELIGLDAFGPHAQEALQGGGGTFAPGTLAAMVGGPVFDWIRQKKIPTFHQLAASGQLAAGRMFVYQGHFFGKGFGFHHKSPLVSLSEDVADHVPGHRLVLEFSKSGITTDTAYTRLGGSTNLFALCTITKMAANRIHAVPYIIGDLVERHGSGIELKLKDTLRLHLSDIRQFQKVDFEWNPTVKQFAKLRDIPEAVVKQAMADLLGEFVLAKDWGGEETDLFSSNLLVGPMRYSAAFLLKGPAKFHEMKLTDCGKNGDQIYRLFNAPADVFVVQHCHKISPAVRRTVEAFTLAEYARRARYALIDGYDTCRILKSLKLL